MMKTMFGRSAAGAMAGLALSSTRNAMRGFIGLGVAVEQRDRCYRKVTTGHGPNGQLESFLCAAIMPGHENLPRNHTHPPNECDQSREIRQCVGRTALRPAGPGNPAHFRNPAGLR